LSWFSLGFLSLQQYKDATDFRALITYSTGQEKPSIFDAKSPISGLCGIAGCVGRPPGGLPVLRVIL
jgi:hypothetical protein